MPNALDTTLQEEQRRYDESRRREMTLTRPSLVDHINRFMTAVYWEAGHSVIVSVGLAPNSIVGGECTIATPVGYVKLFEDDGR